jgi:hypothetical protein
MNVSVVARFYDLNCLLPSVSTVMGEGEGRFVCTVPADYLHFSVKSARVHALLYRSVYYVDPSYTNISFASKKQLHFSPHLVSGFVCPILGNNLLLCGKYAQWGIIKQEGTSALTVYGECFASSFHSLFIIHYKLLIANDNHSPLSNRINHTSDKRTKENANYQLSTFNCQLSIRTTYSLTGVAYSLTGVAYSLTEAVYSFTIATSVAWKFKFELINEINIIINKKKERGY